MIRACIFDMDDLLVRSGPLWRVAEMALLRAARGELVRHPCRDLQGHEHTRRGADDSCGAAASAGSQGVPANNANAPDRGVPSRRC